MFYRTLLWMTGAMTRLVVFCIWERVGVSRVLVLLLGIITSGRTGSSATMIVLSFYALGAVGVCKLNNKTVLYPFLQNPVFSSNTTREELVQAVQRKMLGRWFRDRPTCRFSALVRLHFPRGGDPLVGRLIRRNQGPGMMARQGLEAPFLRGYSLRAWWISTFPYFPPSIMRSSLFLRCVCFTTRSSCSPLAPSFRRTANVRQNEG